MRSILLLLLPAFFLLNASAQSLPEIPHSQRVISLEEVKNYWVNHLPEPREPSRLAREYYRLNVQYHQQVGARHRLIQAISAGKQDAYAKLVMLRHNVVAYRLKGQDDQVLALSEELEKLEAIVAKEKAENEQAERLERLIAATERLAAAIEKNGANLPQDAQQIVEEIVPFERDRNDHRSVITHLHDEIAICNQYPIIIHRRPTSQPYCPPVHWPVATPVCETPTIVIRPSRPSIHPRQPQVRPVIAPRQPSVPQPRVRPAR
ncbi:MAG: hypothetical protein ACI8XO_004264 [Verrucomicrobiales bacterium]|jgi:hypothetical protein